MYIIDNFNYIYILSIKRLLKSSFFICIFLHFSWKPLREKFTLLLIGLLTTKHITGLERLKVVREQKISMKEYFGGPWEKLLRLSV